jgi:hypothetical protein
MSGKVRLPGNPIKMSGMKGRDLAAGAALGEHTDTVLRELLAFRRSDRRAPGRRRDQVSGRRRSMSLLAGPVERT